MTHTHTHTPVVNAEKHSWSCGSVWSKSRSSNNSSSHTAAAQSTKLALWAQENSVCCRFTTKSHSHAFLMTSSWRPEVTRIKSDEARSWNKNDLELCIIFLTKPRPLSDVDWYTRDRVSHGKGRQYIWLTSDAHTCGDSSDLDEWRVLSWKSNPPLSAGHWPPDEAVLRSSGQLLGCWWRRCCWTWLTPERKFTANPVAPAPER